MKVVLTLAGLSPEFGGPSHSVPALAEALGREVVDVDLLACEPRRSHSPPVIPDANLVRTKLLPLRSRQSDWTARRNDFYRTLVEIAAVKDVVIHDNGLWLPTNHAVASAARFLKRPHVISPRGMLSPWALKYHRWKKRLAWILFQRRDFLGASVAHATSEEEVNEFRDTGFRGAIAMIPNGVALPALESAHRTQPSTRSALCVTRLHVKKGLMNLVSAWNEVRPEGWRMIIAGGDEDGHRAELESAIMAHGLTRAFEFVGLVEGETKQKLYRDADLFILPSHSENFGMGIAEALASALPVITTRGTPWRELIERRCGWWEEVGVAPLARALREATSLSDDSRMEMGQRGRELVAEKYSWSRVAKEMKSVYGWLIGQGERPDCVS
jgi:glycosyltransferase involved in cell wall biosynthesis